MKNFRKVIMRMFFVILSSLFLFVQISIFDYGCSEAKENKTVPVYNVVLGPEGCSAMAMAGGLFPEINKWTGKVRLLPLAGGSIAAVRNLSNRADIEGIYTTSTILEQSWTNTGPFAKKPLKKKLYQTFYYNPSASFLLARRDSGIRSMSDLVGKTISIGDPRWSFVPMWVKVLKAMGLWGKVHNKYMGAAEMPSALKSGVIDAVISTTVANIGIPPWTEEICLYNDVVALTMTEEQKKAISSVKGVGFGYTPAACFKRDVGIDQIPSMISYYGIQFAEDTDPDIVYAIVKSIFQHPKELTAIYKPLKTFVAQSKELTINGISSAPHAPVDPGAAKYYKEIGIWQNSWKQGEYNR